MKKAADVPFTADSVGVMAVLDALNALVAHHPKDSSSPWELWCERASKWLLVIAGAAFSMLCLLAGFVYFEHTFPGIRLVASLLGLGSTVFALASMVVQIASGLTLMARFQPYSDRVRAYESRKDYFNVHSLMALDEGFLRQADQWLAFKQQMMEARQALFFGSSDKVAVFALVASGWAMWDKVGKDLMALTNYPLAAGCALLVGLSIGGLMNRLILIRLAYQRGIVKLALDARTGGDKAPVGG